jgi:hypothetical protein
MRSAVFDFSIVYYLPSCVTPVNPAGGIRLFSLECANTWRLGEKTGNFNDVTLE